MALIVLVLLAINAKKFGGHVTLAMPTFEKFVTYHVQIISGITNVKFEVWNY